MFIPVPISQDRNVPLANCSEFMVEIESKVFQCMTQQQYERYVVKRNNIQSENLTYALIFLAIATIIVLPIAWYFLRGLWSRDD